MHSPPIIHRDSLCNKISSFVIVLCYVDGLKNNAKGSSHLRRMYIRRIAFSSCFTNQPVSECTRKQWLERECHQMKLSGLAIECTKTERGGNILLSALCVGSQHMAACVCACMHRRFTEIHETGSLTYTLIYRHAEPQAKWGLYKTCTVWDHRSLIVSLCNVEHRRCYRWFDGDVEDIHTIR